MAKKKEKKAAPAARERVEYLDSMPDPLFVVDLDGVILYTNLAHEKVFGRKAEEIVGRRFDELIESIRPEDIESFVELLGRVIKIGESGSVEALIRSKAGRWIPTSVSYTLVKDADGNPKNIIAILRDITELKRAEEERVKALEEASAEREKAGLIDAMPDALNVLDLDGKIVAVNPAYTKMFGWKPEETIGKGVADMSETFVKPEDLESILKTMGEVIETGTAGRPVEIAVLTKDGRELPISVTYSIIKDTDGNLKNIVTSIRDITELKRAEEDLKAKVKELEDFHDLAVGRELKMKKMEEEMEKIKKESKEVHK